MESHHTHSGIGLPTLLTVLFVALKLLGKIDWSWVWVLAPTWIPIVFLLVAVGVGLLYAVVKTLWR